MKFQVIGSGSKGNCTYISDDNINILIDAVKNAGYDAKVL